MNITKHKERFSSCIQGVWDLYKRDPDTLLALQVNPCVWWNKNKKAAQEAVAFCQAANLYHNTAAALGLHKHPLPLVQVRIRSMSFLLLWHTGIAVRTATEIDFFFCQQRSCRQSCFGILILRDSDLKILFYSGFYTIITKNPWILRSCPLLLHQYEHINTAEECLKLQPPQCLLEG